MKKFFTLITSILLTITIQAQVCTVSGFDVCTGNADVVSNFTNAVQISGTGTTLTVGAMYKFDNAIPSLNLDAVISIDAIVNATMANALNPTIDDDGAADETGVAGTQSALFAPRIMPDVSLSCTNRTGYVEFTVKFYPHYNGNTAPIAGTEISVTNLNFLHFDMDGFTQGADGWFKEIGYVKVIGTNPVNIAAASTELTSGGNVNGWLLTYGSTNERNGVSRCEEVIEKSVYSNAQSTISFRMGYDYKAPSTSCCDLHVQPTRQYGSKFGCFNLPNTTILPVSIINFEANYNSGIANISWTSLQELNVAGYELQKSTDGTNFEVAGYIKATGITTVQQYKFSDNIGSTNANYVYYRLRVIDNNKTMKLSNIISVKITGVKSNKMIISPNPATTSTQIRITTINAAVGNIIIFDASGRAIMQQQASLQAGYNAIVLNNITQLVGGYYTVRLVVGNQSYTSKLLIMK